MVASIIALAVGSYSFIQYLIDRHDRKKEEEEKKKKEAEQNPVTDAIFVLLQDRLEFLLEKAIDRGHTTHIERKKLRGFLTVYEGLDGDDYIHDMWAVYADLPIK